MTEIENQIASANEKAHKMLSEKGFTFGEINTIRNAFVAFSELHDRNISHDRLFDTYSHIKVSGYAFKKENEAKFSAALKEFTGADNEKTMRLFGLISKLSDKNNGWDF